MYHKMVTEGFAVVPPRDDIDRVSYSEECDLFLTFVEPLTALPETSAHFPPGNHFVLSASDAPTGIVEGKTYRVRVTVELIAEDA